MSSELELEQTDASKTKKHCWKQQSESSLHEAEKKVLSCVKTPYKLFYVDIGNVVDQNDKIWTLSLNDESPKTPLVLLHGMAAGLALWCPNLDAFAAIRPVYAIDLLGFGRSSRPKFSKDPLKAEEQWVESLEQWRREMKLEQFILLGHSLGGYIATVYAIKYPERVRHLIPADPWGYPERPASALEDVPFWKRAVINAMEPLNPLSALRAAGPAGKWLMKQLRPDIPRKFLKFVPDAENVILEYIYQCNSQRPSGESAFHTMMFGFAWSKNPLVHRFDQLHPELPITLIFGSLSWVDSNSGTLLKEQRGVNSKTYVQIIEDSGHYVYLDQSEFFNNFVMETCARVDEPHTDTTACEKI